MPRLSNRFNSALLATAILAAPLGPLHGAPDQTLTPIPDRPPAPAFDLQDAQGQPQRLAEHLGKPVILNFWATWCPPCRAEMPAMQRAYQALAAEGIAVIAVNVGDDADAIGEFLEETPVDFPLPMDTDSKVAQRYPMKGLPTTYVIDPQGRLVLVAEGERDWDDPKLLDQVRALKQP
ncbi:MAG TPA: TlpA disulfide reductase family protein [Lamprocystis sp. (in: g-proteobacteria)]|nr:TlpA disulfide reductase family protein [Lamprocystis sp. (in: g-proteobacteria)]